MTDETPSRQVYRRAMRAMLKQSKPHYPKSVYRPFFAKPSKSYPRSSAREAARHQRQAGATA